MRGINVLEKIPIMEMSIFIKTLSLIILLVAIIGGIILGIIKKDKDLTGSIVSSGLLLVIILLFTSCFTSVPSGEYTYKVTVEDTVSFNEFNEKYKIIEQKGDMLHIFPRNQ